MKSVKLLSRTVLVCCICSLCPTSSRSAPALGEEYVGMWVLAEKDEGGRVFKPDESEANDETIKFTKDSVEFVHSGGPPFKGQFRISKQKDMWHVDFVFAKKGAEERVNHAIMRMNGKELQICVSEKFRANEARDRPAEFSTDGKGNKDLDGLILFTYKRK